MNPALSYTWAGHLSLAAFGSSYLLVVFEERIGLRKSKPVVLSGCLMWVFLALYEVLHGGTRLSADVSRLTADIGEIFFFVFAVMIYVNTLQERRVFDALGSWLVRRGFSYRALFWATGAITFLLAPVTASLPGAILMATVVNSVGDDPRFLVPSFIGVVVAANAGGVFSPFGAITTLMVWAAGKASILHFLALAVPSLINYLVPASILSLSVPAGRPEAFERPARMKRGAGAVMILGLSTIAASIVCYGFLGLPPFVGMMLGLGCLMFFGSYLRRVERRNKVTTEEQFDVYRQFVRVEFDTLLFLFGVIMGVGAIRYAGYLAHLSSLYGWRGPVFANVAVGLVSAFIDNVPVMYAVLKMDPRMDTAGWLLVTLTAGVGGSLLSIGSVAGVAVMGVRKDLYTFTAHLRRLPAIAAGYVLSVASFLLIAHFFFRG